MQADPSTNLRGMQGRVKVQVMDEDGKKTDDMLGELEVGSGLAVQEHWAKPRSLNTPLAVTLC